MSRGEAIFPAVLAVGVAALVGGGIFLAGYSWKVIAFPFGAAVIVCGLCLVQIAVVLTGAAVPQPAAAETSALPADAAPESLTPASLIWVFILALFLYGLGFVFGPAAYLLLYLRANGSSWLMSVAISASSLVITWGLFIKALRVLLPIQPLWLG
jgi:hypothetical protein